MRGTLILVVFFITFASASILIPSPMFPGNLLSVFIGEAASQYSLILSAITNGIFYGAILWIFFMIISRKFEEK